MRDKSHASLQSRSKPRRSRPLWLQALTNPCRLLSRHPLARMASDEIFSLSVVAGGTEKKFSLRTKKDKALRESIITKEKADLIQGTIVDLPVTMEFKDSKGVTYASQSSIDLQCQYGTSLQTFGEIFYIVQSCNLDALLRRNISRGQLKDEPSCLPLLFKRQTQEQSNTQKAAKSQACQRIKEDQEGNKINDIQNQLPPKPKKK